MLVLRTMQSPDMVHFGWKFMRRRRSWKRGSERAVSPVDLEPNQRDMAIFKGFFRW